jgi:methionine-rich copper-binding protein CopC
MSLRRRMIVLLAIVGAACGAATRAIAHAIIVDAVPAVGTAVSGPDVAITLRFNSRIDHERSRLSLVGPDGKAQPLPMSRNSAPDVVEAKVSGVAAGEYKLQWQVLAVDGHITRGDIPFRVTAP